MNDTNREYNNTEGDNKNEPRQRMQTSGMRKQKRKKRRNIDKKNLNDLLNGEVDPDLYDDLHGDNW